VEAVEAVAVEVVEAVEVAVVAEKARSAPTSRPLINCAMAAVSLATSKLNALIRTPVRGTLMPELELQSPLSLSSSSALTVNELSVHMRVCMHMCNNPRTACSKCSLCMHACNTVSDTTDISVYYCYLTEGAEAAAEALAMDDVAMLAHAINDNESEV
jgi:hypothetical protein